MLKSWRWILDRLEKATDDVLSRSKRLKVHTSEKPKKAHCENHLTSHVIWDTFKSSEIREILQLLQLFEVVRLIKKNI